MTLKKVLVVGGAGFIGSHVNKLLNAAGYETVIFDNLIRGDRRAVVCGTFVKGDLASEQDLEAVFEKHEFCAVMHFAALTDVGESMLHPGVYYTSNVSNTLNLLKYMVAYKVGVLVFSSSAAVYGTPQESYIRESCACEPINPYGQSKLMGENILRDFERAYDLKYCALRYFNAAGGDPDGEIKNFKTQENNLMPVALRSLLNPKGSVTVFGSDYPTFDGTCIRDYVHVMDLAEAHILSMKALLGGKPSNVFNLGNGTGFSVKEVLGAIEKVTGLRLNIVQGERRDGDPAILVANSEKAIKELQWQPQYMHLEQMVEHAWKALCKVSSECSR